MRGLSPENDFQLLNLQMVVQGHRQKTGGRKPRKFSGGWRRIFISGKGKRPYGCSYNIVFGLSTIQIPFNLDILL